MGRPVTLTAPLVITILVAELGKAMKKKSEPLNGTIPHHNQIV